MAKIEKCFENRYNEIAPLTNEQKTINNSSDNELNYFNLNY